MSVEKKLRILFMDDEIFVENSPPQILFDVLCSRGHAVKAVQTMREALLALVHGVYDLAILDIDMRLASEEMDCCKDGVSVSKFLRSICAHLPVIIYSARGELPHWLELVNYHVYYYADKCTSLNDLLSIIENTCEHIVYAAPSLESSNLKEMLLYVGKFSREENFYFKLMEEAKKSLSDYSFTVCKNYDEVLVRLSEKKCVAILLAEEEFFTYDAVVLEKLQKVCGKQPHPHVVFVIDSFVYKNERNIIPLINLHPFSVIDYHTCSDNFFKAICVALNNAAAWYGSFRVCNESLPDFLVSEFKAVLGEDGEEDEDELHVW